MGCCSSAANNTIPQNKNGTTNLKSSSNNEPSILIQESATKPERFDFSEQSPNSSENIPIVQIEASNASSCSTPDSTTNIVIGNDQYRDTTNDEIVVNIGDYSVPILKYDTDEILSDIYYELRQLSVVDITCAGNFCREIISNGEISPDCPNVALLTEDEISMAFELSDHGSKGFLNKNEFIEYCHILDEELQLRTSSYKIYNVLLTSSRNSKSVSNESPPSTRDSTDLGLQLSTILKWSQVQSSLQIGLITLDDVKNCYFEAARLQQEAPRESLEEQGLSFPSFCTFLDMLSETVMQNKG